MIGLDPMCGKRLDHARHLLAAQSQIVGIFLPPGQIPAR